MTSGKNSVTAPPSIPIGPEAFAPSTETAVYWLTNAGFLINAHGTLLMLDPVISFKPDDPEILETGDRLLVSLPIEASRVPRLDAVLYTHSDHDHCSALTARNLMHTGAVYLATPPVQRKLADLGLPADRIRPAEINQAFQLGNVTITPTPADHGWQVTDRKRFGPPFGPEDCCGYMVETPDGTIWCAGDTRLMGAHFEMPRIDLFLIDCGHSSFHLGMRGAARLANTLDVGEMIPYHWGSYDIEDHDVYDGAFAGDPKELAGLIKNAEHRFHVMAPGQKFVLRRAG